jgi:uncharacterized membrane protein YraQ (UPF0718 family)
VNYETLILNFASIVYEALPFIVLGVVLAGLLEEFVPQQAIAKVIPSNRPLAILLGTLLGAVFPMCECGIIVVMRRLLRKGLPLSVCVSYMLAGPIINVVVIGSTFVAFNVPDDPATGVRPVYGGALGMIALRVGLGMVVAFVTGLVVEREFRKHGYHLLVPQLRRGLEKADSESNELPGGWKNRIDRITATALNDFVDILAFLILGACLAVVGRMILTENNWDAKIEGHPALAILIGMGLAVLFCLCSEADAFVAANFGTFWPPAAKLAFLVLGPMLDLKLLLMYTRVFRRRLIVTIVLSVVAQVFLLSLVVHYLDTDDAITGFFRSLSRSLGVYPKSAQ